MKDCIKNWLPDKINDPVRSCSPSRETDALSLACLPYRLTFGKEAVK